MTNATRKDHIPDGTPIWILVDCTVFGSADNNLAITPRGLFLHNDWAGKTSGSHHVTWRSFMTASIESEGRYNVFVGAGAYLDIAGAGSGAGQVVDLLKEIQKELAQRPDLIID